MASQIHELRNRLTTAALTATAMLDGKLPPEKRHLRELVNALADVTSIAATISKHDWGQSADDQVDVQEIIRSVAADLALAASAAGVRLIVAEPVGIGCRMLRGPSSAIQGALEDAVHALVNALPAGSSIVIAPRGAGRITLTAAAGDDRPLEALYLYLDEIAPYLESRGGRVHLGEEPGEYTLHLPGRPLCCIGVPEIAAV